MRLACFLFTLATVSAAAQDNSSSIVRPEIARRLNLKAAYAVEQASVDGVLGESWLVRHDYVLDYRNRRIVLDAPASDASIRLNTISGIPVVDGVFLNGQGPYRFLLDTGAQTNQVEASLARKIGLVASFQIPMKTVTGSVPVDGGKVDDVTLGSASAPAQLFLFTPLDGPHALSPEIKGVLGQNFLARFDYLLDFAGHRLVIGEPAPEGGNRVNFETIHGCPAVQTSEGKLILDSGANSTILYRSPSSAAEAPTIRTDSGTVSASPIAGLRLRIGEREYRPASAAAIPQVLPSGDGLLPVSLFHAVFVANSGKFAIFDPAVESSRSAAAKK
jgi:hypothetical protein